MAGRRAGRLCLGGRARGPQFCEPVPGLQGLRAFWITADQAAQLLYSGIALAEFQKRVSFLQLRCGRLVSPRILIQNFVVSLHRTVEISLAISNLTQIELRVAREIGVAVYLQILRELL